MIIFIIIKKIVIAFISAFYYENEALKLSLILGIIFIIMIITESQKPYLKNNIN